MVAFGWVGSETAVNKSELRFRLESRVRRKIRRSRNRLQRQPHAQISQWG